MGLVATRMRQLNRFLIILASLVAILEGVVQIPKRMQHIGDQIQAVDPARDYQGFLEGNSELYSHGQDQFLCFPD